MKKLIALIVAIASFAIVHAQNTREQSRTQIFGSRPHTTVQQSRTVVFGGRPNTTVYRTYPVRHDDRNYRVYRDRRHDDDDRDDRNWKHGKEWKEHHDNGKHLGWYKGKGNPHHR